ncbi:hypothetical protein [Rhodocyclus tenuis]|uniref:DNA-binding TFAR19-related protein (PDSD5 family) n=1 Tax=Rhodocyclus tenuis TaxID=1066 RepID=A0A840FZC9_RHOTE|nr:hypothetical protein [Rhodocyclus tenuis]MBB4247244.1 DNA-binding TFAR19-related protein (PDSD5 family) [Rhodocyclus tenuis]
MREIRAYLAAIDRAEIADQRRRLALVRLVNPEAGNAIDAILKTLT